MKAKVNKDFLHALNYLEKGGKPKAEILKTLLTADKEGLALIFAAANRVRQANVGQEVHLRGLLEFSNYCNKDCLYCGLRCANSKIGRYRLEEEEILEVVAEASAFGLKTIVLQSGEDPHYRPEDIARLLEKIKQRHDLAITLSLGEHSYADYKLWREAGADRYLIRHETASLELFKYLKPDTSLEKRLECVDWLKDLGYQTGLGNMVALPGQDIDILVKDLILLHEYDAEMAGVGPFLPHPDTPLRAYPAGSLDLSLQVLALARLCLPQAHFPVTTALRTLSPQAYSLALNAGANVIMPNMTPERVKSKYLIYPQKVDMQEKPEDALKEIHELLEKEKRPLAKSYGHALKMRKEG